MPCAAGKACCQVRPAACRGEVQAPPADAGNVIEKGSYAYGPLVTDNARAGAFLEWSGNTLSDGSELAR